MEVLDSKMLTVSINFVVCSSKQLICRNSARNSAGGEPRKRKIEIYERTYKKSSTKQKKFKKSMRQGCAWRVTEVEKPINLIHFSKKMEFTDFSVLFFRSVMDNLHSAI